MAATCFGMSELCQGEEDAAEGRTLEILVGRSRRGRGWRRSSGGPSRTKGRRGWQAGRRGHNHHGEVSSWIMPPTISGDVST